MRAAADCACSSTSGAVLQLLPPPLLPPGTGAGRVLCPADLGRSVAAAAAAAVCMAGAEDATAAAASCGCSSCTELDCVLHDCVLLIAAAAAAAGLPTAPLCAAVVVPPAASTRSSCCCCCCCWARQRCCSCCSRRCTASTRLGWINLHLSTISAASAAKSVRSFKALTVTLQQRQPTCGVVLRCAVLCGSARIHMQIA